MSQAISIFTMFLGFPLIYTVKSLRHKTVAFSRSAQRIEVMSSFPSLYSPFLASFLRWEV